MLQQPPGVVVNAQQITPAGVQSVYDSRVTSVRFGATADELWVAAHGGVYHTTLGRRVARGAIAGRAGIQGIAYDPVRHRALVSSVGRVPAHATEAPIPGTAQLQRDASVAQLSIFGDAASGEMSPAYSSGPLGEHMAGAPAVARRAGRDGVRVAVLPLPADDGLAVLDADRATPLYSVSLGIVPLAAVVAAGGSAAWVSNVGGEQPLPADRAALQCCQSRAERVAVDARGIASPGTVVRVDLATRAVTARVTVGRHPTALAWDEAHHRLYVADGNDDAVSVVDTERDSLVATLEIAPFRTRATGLAPTALAVSADGGTLAVALGGVNAVALYAIDTAPPRSIWSSFAFASLRGLVPTAWYPSSVDLSADGRRLAVGALFGIGSGEGRTEGSPGKRGRYVFAERGAVNVVDLPADAQLAAWSTAVAANARLPLASSPAPDSTVAAAPPRAVPHRPGDPSRIGHVVYVIKENRTYDQVLGDLGRGDSDSSLVIFGRAVTPNQHALAEQFVTLDRTFASGGNSADGHQWLTQANETEYATWPLYFGRSYPSEGEDALAYSSGGFLWEAAASRGRPVRVFGEYAPSIQNPNAARHDSLLIDWTAKRVAPASYFRDQLRARYDTRSTIPSLDSVLVREYPGWTEEVPDVVKIQDVLAHLADWERAKTMPALTMIVLPNDHTSGTAGGWCTPRACVADNDLALGQLVEGLSRSSFWRDMAIFVIEDDAQNGVDHVDGHRTTAFVASPFAKRGVVDHTAYNQPSVVKTIELMLGLPSMSVFDLVATDMRASFIGDGESPDFRPFTALPARIALDERNQHVGAIRGAGAASRRRDALASARMRFDGPDEAPSELLNRILWRAARGPKARYPAVRRAVFLPMSREIADEERDRR